MISMLIFNNKEEMLTKKMIDEQTLAHVEFLLEILCETFIGN